MLARQMLTLVAAQLALAGVAQATTLTTAPLVRSGGELSCLVTNASQSEIEVEIRIMYPSGASVGGLTAKLSPSQTASSSSEGGPYDHCEFRFVGSAKRVRAIACTGPVNGACTAVAPAQ